MVLVEARTNALKKKALIFAAVRKKDIAAELDVLSKEIDRLENEINLAREVEKKEALDKNKAYVEYDYTPLEYESTEEIVERSSPEALARLPRTLFFKRERNLVACQGRRLIEEENQIDEANKKTNLKDELLKSSSVLKEELSNISKEILEITEKIKKIDTYLDKEI
jgi:hypothetical protein